MLYDPEQFENDETEEYGYEPEDTDDPREEYFPRA